MKKSIWLIILLLLAGSLQSFASGNMERPEDSKQTEKPANSRIKLATTTSTDNSGLLGYLLPVFREKTGYHVDVIAVGTGAALTLGKKGDVDVVLVHARVQEDEFANSGYGVDRKDVMHNDFVIIGPPDDPAGITGADSASQALSIIAGAEADFVSRGDNSGTHFKEKQLWERTGSSLSGKWYKEAGQGMGAVITMANDLQGYTLSDRGTFIAMKTKVNIVVLFEGDPLLFNPYGIIAVNPELYSHVNNTGAEALIDWIISPEAQQLIARFKVGGEQLFYPDAME